MRRQLILYFWLFSPLSVAQANDDICQIPHSDFDATMLMPSKQIKVEANNARIIDNNIAEFEGEVDIFSDTARIRAEQARVNKNGEQLFARGGVYYQDAQVEVRSTSVDLDSRSETLSMTDTLYTLSGFTGNGSAELIELSNDNGLVLKDVNFTTCPMGNEDWKLKASQIELDPDKAWGKAKNTQFLIGNVPVFYLPYFAFPVSEQRQTGLLFPTIDSSSSTGLDYEQPFYWNIAPNMDATISPRFMTRRGLQLKSEFRYLTEQHQGELHLEYLPNDGVDGENRYFYRYIHHGQLSDAWSIYTDFNGLSDDNYIVDLGSDFYNRADTHLYRTVGSNYYSENLDITLQIRDFEVIGDHPDTYRALPEAKLSYRADDVAGFNFKLDSELAYFDNQQGGQPTALRWHIQPSISLPLRRQWGEVEATGSVMNTYYRQDDISGTELADEVNRTLGQFSLYGELNFERESQWFGKAATMTLEPKAQYLFTSYEDQSAIGFYDTTKLLNDYDGLFRGDEFTGLDRISDNNQVTLGVTSRIIDQQSREQFVVSVGQIFYLSENKVIDATKDDDRSALAGELDFRFSEQWFAHTDAQVSTATDKVERSSITLEYRQDSERFIQLSHRYVRDLSGEKIDQAGLSASWPLTKDWQWVGRWYKDLERQRTIETYTGIQYESCCWAIRVVGYRHLSNRFDSSGEQTFGDFDSGVRLNFIFKGIGTSNSSRSMLQNGMFGYRQPYVLN